MHTDAGFSLSLISQSDSLQSMQKMDHESKSTLIL